MNWTQHQKAIFEFVKNRKENLIVQAGPGAAKTSSIIEACNYIKGGRTILLSFSKLIADELADRVPWPVESATLNALGNRIVRGELKGVIIPKGESKDEKILRDVIGKYFLHEGFYYKLKGVIVGMIGLLKNNLVMDLDKEYLRETINELIRVHGIDTPGITGRHGTIFEDILVDTYIASVNNIDREITFDDQKFVVVSRDLIVKKYDTVLVDETQDLSPLDIALVRKVGNRAIFIGDKFQSIYGWRGALNDAMESIKIGFGCEELTLPICFRCPENVIKEAQRINVDLRSPTDFGMENRNGNGVVEWMKKEGMRKILREIDGSKDNHGDHIVLCRTTAPLIKECLKNLGEIPCYVKGKDIREGLERLVGIVSGGNERLLIEDFDSRLGDYYLEQRDRLMRLKREVALGELDDKVDALKEALIPKCGTVGELNELMRKVIVDSGVGVAFMTIHKCKGLERKHVYWLRPDLCPHKRARLDWQLEQERNLRFVATTRSKESLRYIEKEAGEK